MFLMHLFLKMSCSHCYTCSWNEWLTLPVKYSDLPRTAKVSVFTCKLTNIETIMASFSAFHQKKKCMGDICVHVHVYQTLDPGN